MSAHVAGIGLALPPAIDQRELYDEWFVPRWAPDRQSRFVWRRSGVETRHAVIDPRQEDVASWSTAARMRRYVDEAMPLGVEAIRNALDAAGARASDIDSFTVVSCTGYATPGLDIGLARDLGMHAGVRRNVLGHMGCHAALPGLGVGADAVAVHGGTALVLCLELSSLHGQLPDDDPEQAVVHAIFSDAAGALVLTPAAPGLEVVEIAALTGEASQDAMTWTVTDNGFRMTLSAEVPRLLASQVRGHVEGLLSRHGLRLDDVGHWAIHPGGPRILDVCAEELGLDDAAIEPSRATLREHGNASSATIILVLERLCRDVPRAPGDPIVALAFGPGLTLYAALLRERP